MFSHVMLGTDDLDASMRFYDAALAPLDIPPARRDDKGRAIYMHRHGLLLLSRPINGEPACHANGGTVGFSASSTEKVDAWHAAGVAEGGTAIEEPPGWRENAFGRLYLAYLRDPAGNKVCAVYREMA